MKQLYPFVALAVMLAGGYFFFTQFKIDRDGRVVQRDPNELQLPRSKGKSGSLGDSLSKIGDSIRDTIDPEHKLGQELRRDTTGKTIAKKGPTQPTRRPYDDPRDTPTDRGNYSPRDPNYRDPNYRERDPNYRDPNYREPRGGDPYYDDRRARDPYADRPARASYNGRPSQPARNPGAPVAGQTIRVASFNIQDFGETKLSRPAIVELLSLIVQHFDIVAIQEVSSRNQDFISRFLEFVNHNGRRYRDVVGPREGRTVQSQEQYTYLYDTETIVCDESAVYAINDPDNLLTRPPLVAAFACRNAPIDQAFTFTLINVHTKPDFAKEECDVLDDVMRAVRDDGRGEDDIVLLGDFNASPKQMRHLSGSPQNFFVVTNQFTNTQRSRTNDNIIFNRTATTEYAGKGGVFDFLRAYNLTQQEAVKVSDHMPVWAEFSVYENGASHRVARTPW